MHFQFDVSPVASPAPESTPGTASEMANLLRQILEVQREQLTQLRAAAAAQDAGARWRAFVARWRQDFPDLPEACRQAVPVLERSYGKLMEDLTNYLSENGPETLEDDFSLQEFLDRFGMRLAQLGSILNLVAPLAE